MLRISKTTEGDLALLMEPLVRPKVSVPSNRLIKDFDNLKDAHCSHLASSKIQDIHKLAPEPPILEVGSSKQRLLILQELN
jgi:hypothetical protein